MEFYKKSFYDFAINESTTCISLKDPGRLSTRSHFYRSNKSSVSLNSKNGNSCALRAYKASFSTIYPPICSAPLVDFV